MLLKHEACPFTANCSGLAPVQEPEPDVAGVGLRGAREAVGFRADALRKLVEQEGGAIGRGLGVGGSGQQGQRGGEESFLQHGKESVPKDAKPRKVFGAAGKVCGAEPRFVARRKGL